MRNLILALSIVKFDKSRLRKYYGNIAEIIAQEVLEKAGFESWLLTPYFSRGRESLPKSGYLSQLLLRRVFQKFLGQKMEVFLRYLKKSGYIPDLIAKKGEDIYLVEVKANREFKYLNEEQKIGLKSAREYGFKSMIITMDVAITASNLKIIEIQE